MPADIAVRRADPAEADLVGELTKRIYRETLARDQGPPAPYPAAATPI